MRKTVIVVLKLVDAEYQNSGKNNHYRTAGLG